MRPPSARAALCALFSLALCPAPHSLLHAQSPDSAEGVRLSSHPQRTLQLLVFTPEIPGRYPAILALPSAPPSSPGFESEKTLLQHLAQRGFVTAILRTPEGRALDTPSDARAALAFLQSHAESLPILPHSIGILGTGRGTLAAADAAFANPKHPVSIQACMLLENAPEFPPNRSANRTPPTLLVSSSAPLAEARIQIALEALRARSAAPEIVPVQNAPADFWMQPPWAARVEELAARFFATHLGGVQPLIPD
ncbi:MAG: hypothetical protein RLZZ244_2553 [Verrucomicrobiota bacterium]